MNWNVAPIMALVIFLQGCGAQNSSQAIEQKYTNHASKFATVEGKRVHYRDEGQGEVVILLHGTSSSLHAWEQWTQILKQDYRVVRPLSLLKEPLKITGRPAMLPSKVLNI